MSRQGSGFGRLPRSVTGRGEPARAGDPRHDGEPFGNAYDGPHRAQYDVSVSGICQFCSPTPSSHKAYNVLIVSEMQNKERFSCQQYCQPDTGPSSEWEDRGSGDMEGNVPCSMISECRGIPTELINRPTAVAAITAPPVRIMAIAMQPRFRYSIGELQCTLRG